MTISLYLDQDSWLHRLDARSKILAVLALFALALLYTQPLYLLGLWGLVSLLIMSARVFLNIRKILILLILLFVYSLMLWPLFVEGQTPIFSWSPATITIEGVTVGFAMGLRLTFMVVSGVLLLSTTRLEDFTLALERLGVPSSISFALSLAFRWVPALLGAGTTIIQAQRVRGLNLSEGTVFQKVRAYVPLVVPLIGHTLRQTTLLTMALEAKGFHPGRVRHASHVSRFGFWDYGVLLIVTCLIGVSGWLRIRGYQI